MHEDEYENYDSFTTNSRSGGEFQLYVSVTGFEAKTINREEVIFYKIELYSYLTENEWSLVHRYNDFYELFLILSKFFFKVPQLPSKSISKVTSLTDLNKRKESLNKFLNGIITRPDLISNAYTIRFLKLENHFPDFHLFQPLLIYNLENLSYPITAFHYDKTTSLLFVGISNSSISGKINNYFSKIFSGNTSKNSENTPGFLLIYNIIKNNSGAHHFEQIYEKALPSEVSSMNFYLSKNILCVGMSNGGILLHKIFINESSKITRELVEEVCLIKAHKKRVVGCCINFTFGYVYSVARENNLIITEMNYQSIIKTISVSKKEITAMAYDENWGRLFLTDDMGSIWIMDLATNALQPKVLQAAHNQIPHITAIELNLQKNILFIGNKNGTVVTYELENYDEKIIPQYELMSSINIKKKLEIKTDASVKVTCIKYTQKNEIIISFSNGAIAIYSHEESNPEYVIDSHTQEITGMFWDEDKKMLLSLSIDKSIKLYQFPIFWPSEMIRKSKAKNQKSLIACNETKEKIEDDDLPINKTKKEEKIKDEFQSNYENGLNLNRALSSGSKKKITRELTTKEIICEDLDGWDHD